MNQHSRMPVLVLTCPDRQVILYNYPKCCFFKPKLQLFSLTPSIWVPQNNDRTRTEWQRPSVVPAPSCWRHETDACTWILSQLGCMSQKWNSGLMGTECIASQRNQLMVPALAEPRSPAQRLSGEVLIFLLDQGGRLPEGVSHLLQETCSAWYKTTGWELILPGTNGNFDVHNSGLGCHWKACDQ